MNVIATKYLIVTQYVIATKYLHQLLFRKL